MFFKTNCRLLYRLSLLLFVGGCITGYPALDFDVLYGPSSVKNRVLTRKEQVANENQGNISYLDDVKPILDSRCIVCHACYDAPCQLKLNSPEGIDRGASKQVVYDGERLTPASPTRLFIDANSTAEWRQKQFFPVLNERDNTYQARLNNSVLSLLLSLKRNNPLPQEGRLPEEMSLGLDESTECPTRKEFPEYQNNHPLWGMPYALPGLNQPQEKLLSLWLLEGAKVPAKKALSPTAIASIAKWESFFNGATAKRRLMARYIYEHLFIGHLHFQGHPANEFYHLVRSRTPTGVPVNEIPSVRPYDDPGPEFYYRLRPITSTIVDKNHFVYELSDSKMDRYRELFLEPSFSVKDLPDYRPEDASNPFKTFALIPPRSRFKFLLDDAQYFISGFIKGPVCRGQIALNVIRDQFWVTFFNPDLEYLDEQAQFLAENSQYLSLPAADGDHPSLLGWQTYDSLAMEYMKKKQAAIDRVLPKSIGPNLEFIWDGDGHNQNATLTVFRHHDSATVVKGLIGNTPLTAWVVSYSVLERIHYLLVAGFNVYGAVGHQLATRKYMDFLRMEAENDFLRFLPANQRKTIRKNWYRGIAGQVASFFNDPLFGLDRPSALKFRTSNPKKEFFDLLQDKLGRAAITRDVLNRCSHSNCVRPGISAVHQRVEAQLKKITRLNGKEISALPEISFLRISTKTGQPDHFAYTLIYNKMLENVSSLLAEDLRRIKSEDTVTLIPGFLGSYPNFFFSVEEKRLPEFINALRNAQDNDSSDLLYRTFGVRRNDPRIWELSDWFNRAYQKEKPIESGWFDLNRYQNL